MILVLLPSGHFNFSIAFHGSAEFFENLRVLLAQLSCFLSCEKPPVQDVSVLSKIRGNLVSPFRFLPGQPRPEPTLARDAAFAATPRHKFRPLYVILNTALLILITIKINARRGGQSLLLAPGQDELNKRSANDNDSSERELCLASNFHSSRNAIYVCANLRP